MHLEGPFISEARKGAHRAECMLDPTDEALDVLLRWVLVLRLPRLTRLETR